MKKKAAPPPRRRPPRIGVLGPHTCTQEEYKLGVAVGAAIARHSAILLCGGLGGMMTAAAEGAQREGGLTIGILPGESVNAANEFIDIALPTGLGAYRNALLVRSCSVVIAICGQYGTLSEIAYALRLGVPVIGLHTWQVVRKGKKDPGIQEAKTPEEAVKRAISACLR